MAFTACCKHPLAKSPLLMCLYPTDFHQIQAGRPSASCPLPLALYHLPFTTCPLPLALYHLPSTTCPLLYKRAQLPAPVSPPQDSKAATPGVKPSHLLCITVEEVGGPTTTTPPSLLSS